MTTKPEPTILPVRPGTLDAYDKSQLRKAGVIVIEHENPAELRLMKPNVDISGNAMLGAAMKALGSNSMASAAVGQREVFFQLLTKIINGANDRSEPTEPLAAKVGSTDGLGGNGKKG